MKQVSSVDDVSVEATRVMLAEVDNLFAPDLNAIFSIKTQGEPAVYVVSSLGYLHWAFSFIDD
jgi:hypothetical protein